MKKEPIALNRAEARRLGLQSARLVRPKGKFTERNRRSSILVSYNGSSRRLAGMIRRVMGARANEQWRNRDET